MKAHRCALAGMWLADVAVLLLLRPSVAELAHDLAHPRVWLATVGTDRALVTFASVAVWLCALWFGAGLLAAVARRMPGVLGRVATRVCAAMLPKVVQRLAVGSAGLGVLLAPLPASAAGRPTPPPTPTVTAAPTSAPGGTAVPPALPAPIWPSSAPATLPPPSWPSSSLPSSTSPQPDRAGSGTAGRPRVHEPRRPEPHPSGTGSGHGPARRSGDHTTVRPGDCLWLIAARRLGPHPTDAAVAASWPRWYAANRAVIGNDPDLVTPGQVLWAPTRDPGKSQQPEESRS